MCPEEKLYFVMDSLSPYEDDEDSFPMTKEDEELIDKIIKELNLVTKEMEEAEDARFKELNNSQKEV